MKEPPPLSPPSFNHTSSSGMPSLCHAKAWHHLATKNTFEMLLHITYMTCLYILCHRLSSHYSLFLYQLPEKLLQMGHHTSCEVQCIDTRGAAYFLPVLHWKCEGHHLNSYAVDGPLPSCLPHRLLRCSLYPSLFNTLCDTALPSLSF